MSGSSAAVTPILANAENRYEVTRSDLPLSCPMPGMALWNSIREKANVYGTISACFFG